MTTPIQIFLCTDSAMRRELWRTVLSTTTQNCCSEIEEISAETPIDVVLTDQALDEQTLERLAVSDGNADGARYDGGLVNVGVTKSEHSADVTPQDPIVDASTVSLPADATARELKLSVLLLTQIVRLRRQHDTEQSSPEYEQLAFQDPLTSIANRRAWDQELAKRWENRGDSEGTICLALLDVDQLKQVNDSLGHAEGDAVLRATASALVASVRDHDFVARLGGDEFGVLLEDIDPTSAHRIVDRIRCSTSRYLATGETSSDEIPVTTSAGYACARPEDSLESLFRRGDQALLGSKRDGGNATMGDLETQ